MTWKGHGSGPVHNDHPQEFRCQRFKVTDSKGGGKNLQNVGCSSPQTGALADGRLERDREMIPNLPLVNMGCKIQELDAKDQGREWPRLMAPDARPPHSSDRMPRKRVCNSQG